MRGSFYIGGLQWMLVEYGSFHTYHASHFLCLTFLSPNTLNIQFIKVLQVFKKQFGSYFAALFFIKHLLKHAITSTVLSGTA